MNNENFCTYEQCSRLKKLGLDQLFLILKSKLQYGESQ